VKEKGGWTQTQHPTALMNFNPVLSKYAGSCCGGRGLIALVLPQAP